MNPCFHEYVRLGLLTAAYTGAVIVVIGALIAFLNIVIASDKDKEEHVMEKEL